MAKVKSPSTVSASGIKTLNAKRLEFENRKLVQKNEELKQRNRELDLISQSFLSINSSLELDRVLSTILEAIKNLFGVVGSSIWLKDQQTGEVVCRQAADASAFRTRDQDRRRVADRVVCGIDEELARRQRVERGQLSLDTIAHSIARFVCAPE